MFLHANDSLYIMSIVKLPATVVHVVNIPTVSDIKLFDTTVFGHLD